MPALQVLFGRGEVVKNMVRNSKSFFILIASFLSIAFELIWIITRITLIGLLGWVLHGFLLFLMWKHLIQNNCRQNNNGNGTSQSSNQKHRMGTQGIHEDGSDTSITGRFSE